MSFINSNADTHNCKMVQDFLETESLTMVQPLILPIQQTSYNVTFLVYFTKTNLSDVDMSFNVLLAVPFVSAYRVCPKEYTYLIFND